MLKRLVSGNWQFYEISKYFLGMFIFKYKYHLKDRVIPKKFQKTQMPCHFWQENFRWEQRWRGTKVARETAIRR